MYAYQKIVEQKLQEAVKKGEFDNLPSKGKPLALDDDTRIPEDLRLAYKILKNGDCLPPELVLRKEIRKMEDMLDKIPNEKEKYRQLKRINHKIMRLNMMGHQSPLLEENQVYYARLVEKSGNKR